MYRYSNSSIIKNHALEMLIRSKYKLVVSIAKKFVIDANDYDDIVSEGLKGLITGIDKFGLNQGYKLSTYVYLWIVQSIQRKIGNYKMIYLPEQIRKLGAKIEEIKEQYKQENGGMLPTIDYIASELNTTAQKILNAINLNKFVLSYDNFMENSDNDTSFENLVIDENLTTDKQLINLDKNNEFIEIIHNVLNENEVSVIEHYFGINGCEKISINDIAKKLCLSEARIKQIKKQALSKLQQNKQLKIFG